MTRYPMSIIDSDYFINVIEFMPIKQLAQFCLVCRAVDKFIKLLPGGSKYSAQEYIIRSVGTIVDKNFIKYDKQDSLYDHIYFYYFNENLPYDTYELRVLTNGITLKMNNNTIFNKPFFHKIKEQRQYNIYKIIKIIFNLIKYDGGDLLERLLSLYSLERMDMMKK